MIEINNTTKFKINKKEILKITELFLKKHKFKNSDISIAFISDNKMRQLNKNYRKINKTTDVLSFDNERIPPLAKGEVRRGLGGGKGLDGEILISPSQIKKQAKESKKTFRQELIFILVHGLLHLAGHNDETEKGREKMIKMGDEFLNKNFVV